LRPKLVAILVVGILTLSMVVTAVGAIGQAVAGDAATSPVEQAASAPILGGDTNTATTDRRSGDGAALRAFKFVCPFH
jgi:hypothetical protein